MYMEIKKDLPEQQILLEDPLQMDNRPDIPFSQPVVDFLSDLSDHAGKLPRERADGFLRAFGFWCRKTHLKEMKKEYERETRLGLGMTFHIAPSNVPGLFLWSLAIGLLAGNSCIVRISEKRLEQAQKSCRFLADVLEKHQEMKRRIAIISYPSEKMKLTEYYSSQCDGRIVWGGDETIRLVQKCTISPRAEDLYFPDRVSAAVISAREMLRLSGEERKTLAEKFYRDTYDMDQNACSSPSLILWYEEEDGEGKQAADLWWMEVKKRAERYKITEKQVFEKYRLLCSLAIKREDWMTAKRYGNQLYILPMETIGKDIWEARGNSGFFLEYTIRSLDELEKIEDSRAETLTYFGLDKEELKAAVVRGRMKGFSHIVPMGQALAMEPIWDGKDMIRQLSRRLI